MFTTLEGAIALLLLVVLATTRPVLAHDHAASAQQASAHAHHHHAEAPVTPVANVLMASHLFRVGSPVAARLYDARAYYRELHRLHPDHPGIPTHRLELLMSSSRPAALSTLVLSGPDGQIREVPLVRDGDRMIAELELKSPGAIRLTLAGVPGKHASWSYLLRP